MENQDVTQKAPRTEPAKSTLPQPGRPIPSRAYPGALIVVEGTDGSGKSTQLYLLKRWLEIGGYRLHFTEWNSSPLVKSATRRGKQRRLLTPTTFSLLHAADFADRCERQIMPLLQGDYLVLADRYIYTAFARDASRGCPPRWLRNLYRFAPIPDITFYFRAPLDIAVHRILSGRPKLKYYEAGMDLGLSYDRAESFRLFQARILEGYDNMVESDNFVVLDGTLPVNKLQKRSEAFRPPRSRGRIKCPIQKNRNQRNRKKKSLKKTKRKSSKKKKRPLLPSRSLQSPQSRLPLSPKKTLLNLFSENPSSVSIPTKSLAASSSSRAWTAPAVPRKSLSCRNGSSPKVFPCRPAACAVPISSVATLTSFSPKTQSRASLLRSCTPPTFSIKSNIASSPL